MNQGNAGLLALCILLGGTAFAVLFVAPRFVGGDGPLTTVEEQVSAGGAPSGAADAPAAGQAEEQIAAVPKGDRAEGAATADAVPEATETNSGVADAAVAENADRDSSQATDEAGQEAAVAQAEEGEDAVSADIEEARMPAFDLLRVEPDGSAVIAGRAEPGQRLEILNGDDVVASVDVGPSGDFAAVLDEPLSPGNHSLSLRSTDEGDRTVRSEEIATISIPEGDQTELLAMVTRPGEASRIISQPQAPADGVAGEGAATAAAGPAGGAAAGEESPEAAASATEDVADTRIAAPADRDALNEAGVQDEATPDGSAETETAALAPGDEAAATPERSPAAAQSAEPASVPAVRIDAVEVEGDGLFVAGSTRPGATVRIYADDVVVGDDRATGEGRFLVEGRVPLSVGEHRIRADLIEGGQVVARAIVPFMRPDGEVAAAVAANDAPAASAPPEPEVAAREQPDSPSQQDVDAGEPTELAAMPPSAEDRPDIAAEQDLPTASEIRPGSTERSPAPPSAPPAASASRDAAPEADDAMSEMAAASSEVEAASGRNATPEQVPAPSSAAPEGASSAGEPASEPVTIEQAALTPSDASVIIRRGDTLWQISRRVYGQGVRYTTIYLANQDQITNPDRILPGQIFSVPEEALENSEELHRQRLRR
jgi:nucleoid-associated protein YgaU